MSINMKRAHRGAPLRIPAANYNAWNAQLGPKRLALSAPPPKGGKSRAGTITAVPCEITSHLGGGVYAVSLHANGKTQPPTGVGEIELLSVHIGEVLEAGDWVLGFPSTVRITGGTP